MNIAGLVWQRGGGALDQSRCCSETRDQAQKNNSTLNATVSRFQYMSQRNVLWHANTQPEVDEATATSYYRYCSSAEKLNRKGNARPGVVSKQAGFQTFLADVFEYFEVMLMTAKHTILR